MCPLCISNLALIAVAGIFGSGSVITVALSRYFSRHSSRSKADHQLGRSNVQESLARRSAHLFTAANDHARSFSAHPNFNSVLKLSL
jgi:hypothetical protein